MNRLAGKVLGDFFKTGAGMISSAAEKGSLGYLQNAVNAAANAVDTPGVMGNIAQFASGMDPAAVAKLVGSAAPVAANHPQPHWHTCPHSASPRPAPASTPPDAS